MSCVAKNFQFPSPGLSFWLTCTQRPGKRIISNTLFWKDCVRLLIFHHRCLRRPCDCPYCAIEYVPRFHGPREDIHVSWSPETGCLKKSYRCHGCKCLPFHSFSISPWSELVVIIFKKKVFISYLYANVWRNSAAVNWIDLFEGSIQNQTCRKLNEHSEKNSLRLPRWSHEYLNEIFPSWDTSRTSNLVVCSNHSVT